MATSAVILVLAWVPGIDIEQFKPFGLEFTKESGSLLSVWCLLAVILIYYVVRFSVDLWVDFLEWNLSRKRMDAKWQRAQQGRTVCARADKPAKPFLMSVLPAASHIRAFIGTGIMRSASKQSALG